MNGMKDCIRPTSETSVFPNTPANASTFLSQTLVQRQFTSLKNVWPGIPKNVPLLTKFLSVSSLNNTSFMKPHPWLGPKSQVLTIQQFLNLTSLSLIRMGCKLIRTRLHMLSRQYLQNSIAHMSLIKSLRQIDNNDQAFCRRLKKSLNKNSENRAKSIEVFLSSQVCQLSLAQPLLQVTLGITLLCLPSTLCLFNHESSKSSLQRSHIIQ